jgi:hypothetical protein
MHRVECNCIAHCPLPTAHSHPHTACLRDQKPVFHIFGLWPKARFSQFRPGPVQSHPLVLPPSPPCPASPRSLLHWIVGAQV